MKILLAGEWQAEIHEQAWAEGLRALGHAVTAFSWFETFHPRTGRLRRLSRRVQGRLLAGPIVWALNRRLLAVALEERPDVVLIYRGTPVLPRTLQRIAAALPETVLATYNNDDPFSKRARAGLWRHYLRGLRFTDVNLAYRHKSVDDLRWYGARDVQLVRSAFVPSKDHPVDLTPEDRRRYGSDVVFAGHFEPDGRLEALRCVAEGPWRFRLFGPDWERAPSAAWLNRLQPIHAVRGEEYAKAICGARIALCFLSTLNNDTYTRRCFEIPAMGTMLLCERSADMEQLFAPGLEADYFSTPAELLAKLQAYLPNEELRARIARAGHEKVKAAGHDIYSRMKEVDGILRDAIVRKRRAGPDSD